MRRRTLNQIAPSGFAILAAIALVAALAFAWRSRAGLNGRTTSPAGALQTAVAEVEAGRRTTPIVREVDGTRAFEVTFLAQSANGVPPRIVSDATGWGEQPGEQFSFEVGRMTEVAGAGGREGPFASWYSLSTRVMPRARVEYLVAYAPGDYRVDPHNPRRARFRLGSPASEFITPGYLPPAAPEALAAGTAGQVFRASIDSRALSETVPVVVYTPPGYRRDGVYPLVVFHDRLNWGHEGEGPRLLDHLIVQRRIEPVVAVFAGSGRPGDENVPAVRQFLAEDLPRWMESRYGVTVSAANRAVLGVSYGAKDALEAATGEGACYGRVGLLIPGRRLRPTDIDALAARPGARLRLVLLAALYDAPNLAAARGVRTAFAAAGHQVDYIEVPEGHNAATWRDHAGEIVAALFARR